jgi:Pectate lyase superfamily protein/Right handed beta helix region
MRLSSVRLFAVLLVASMPRELCFAIGSTPGGPSDLDVVSVKRYGAVGDGSTDDTNAISAAVASAPAAGAGILNIYFPSGVYAIRRAITIPSNIRLFGDGESSVVYQTKAGANVFQGGGTSGSMASNITVEKLRFRGSGGFQTNYGLSLNSVQHLLFKDNSAETIPLINVTSPATSDESRRSANFLISGNHATGHFGEGAAILVSYAVDGVIRDNVIDTYDSGIQFWGGDARNPAWLGVKRLEITSNTVRNVGAAAWGSAGRQITITGNHVGECTDVCLDVEGSADVAISGNDVGNAANGGIAAFFASSHVNISSNTVSQDSSHGSAIFIHGTGATQSTLIASNKLQVLGTSPAINTSQGALANSTIQANEISSAAAAIHILEGDGVSVLSNNIRVGGPTGVAFEGGSGGQILDNVITNTGAGLPPDTSQGGIHIYWRSAAKPAQNNRIENNTIVGFPISINDDCWGDHASLNVMRNNTLDTIYHRGNGASYHGTIEQNHTNLDPKIPVSATSY